MSKKYWGSMNLNAIKEAIEGGVTPFEGKKGKYLDIQVWVNDEPDQFGNHLSISVYNKGPNTCLLYTSPSPRDS